MDTGSVFTTYDFVILGILVLFIGRGLWTGFIQQISVFVALYLGYFVASQYYSTFFPFWEHISQNPKIVFWGSYAIAFLLTYVLAMLIGLGLRHVVELTFTSWLDSLLGGIVGFAKAALVIVLLHLFLGTIMAPENKMLRDCASCEVVADVSDYARRLIKDSGVQEAFLMKDPALSLERVKEYLEPIMPSK
ncbi:CvpA family protein [Desulfotalea psychrophila]|uniref:Colicin V production protein n=1 Tax=Desulfotalea psychrophila (strain LSv54 / DSM 12343) TaxID=177439 RepID=Q6APT0_DESPS|nr:CvpA family protein [Desulfotalea psychrophila]CAG35644.1 unknown protein [Desulfotalea psychrophila LSv54]